MIDQNEKKKRINSKKANFRQEERDYSITYTNLEIDKLKMILE